MDVTEASMAAVRSLAGKRVLVTGACGTVGSKLVEILASNSEVAELVAIDHNETELVFLEERFRADNIRFLLCDIRDRDTMYRVMRNIDVVFHVAAYKHVYVCERSPLEAVMTNIIGVQNVLQAAHENGVGRLVFTSSDKAVNPTNVMGTSKLMGERLVTAAALDAHQNNSVFLSTRFGNVLGSRGSVVPIFREQIRLGKPLTLTDGGMTRFIMSLEQAALLIIQSAQIGQPGDVLISKMPAISIGDLAHAMIEELAPVYGRRPADIPIEIIGTKPGEKMYEELMNEEETRRSYEIDRYFVVRPAMHANTLISAENYGQQHISPVAQPYNSSNCDLLRGDELRQFLRHVGLTPAN